MTIALAPFRALCVALIGAGLAWLWFRGEIVVPIVVTIALIALAIGTQPAGDASLPRHPVRARWLFECWTLVQLVLSAVAATLVIVITVALAAPDSASDQTKQLVSALTTALTTFVTATLAVGDDADEKIGERIKAKFYGHYDRDKGQQGSTGYIYFKVESEAERWLLSENYGDIEGWGWKARAKRVKELAKRLKTDDVARVGKEPAASIPAGAGVPAARSETTDAPDPQAAPGQPPAS
jgi:hypothetical protein